MTRLRRPVAVRAGVAVVVAVLFGLFGLPRLLVAVLPSDPCAPQEAAACAASDRAWLIAGVAAVLVAAVAAGIGARLIRRRARLVFRAPPGWPDPPSGWRPSGGWAPDPAWPAPPEGWVFWVDPRGQ